VPLATYVCLSLLIPLISHPIQTVLNNAKWDDTLQVYVVSAFKNDGFSTVFV